MSSSDTGDAVADDSPSTGVNPASWSRRLGHDQAQLRTGVQTLLTIGGQRPVDSQGRLLHEGDLAAQLALALDNLTDVVVEAGMQLADLAHLHIHTTNMNALLEVLFVITEHLTAHAASTPITIVGVSSLAIAGMEVEIHALAVAAVPRTHAGGR